MRLLIGQYDHPVVNTMKINLSSYIISTSNVHEYDLSYYDGIVFVGGTLSKLKHPRGMEIQFDEKANKNYIEYTDDKQTISFSTGAFECNVTIGSSIRENRNLEGASITNQTVYLQMEFSKPQATSTVYMHYGKLCEMLSFLTNRKNVGVDEIYLLHKDVPIQDTKITDKIAQVFIKQDKSFTQKPIYNNLEFECLGASITTLLEILYKTQDRKRSYSLGFYPEDDERERIITNDMLRNVCSALECELEFVQSIRSTEHDRIKALKKQVQPIIEAHKASAERLCDKTYSLIESSISHWTMAASDQFKALYHMFDEEMQLANKSSFVISDDDIDAFVKYRNDITHGSYRVLDPKIGYTTYLMACLVYCCVLTRIGIPRADIKQWFSDGRLLR